MKESAYGPVALGRRIGGSRRLDAICLVIALLVHVPILSLGAWSFIASLFQDRSEDEGAQEVEVPLELDVEDEPQKIDKSDPKSVDVQVVTDGPDAVPPPSDAGVPDAAPVDAGAPDAAPRDAAVDAPTDAPAPPPADAAPPPNQTPLESVRAPKNPSGNPNNVEIVLVGKVLRTHPIGVKLGQMLPNIKQWKDFFDNTGIDAVRDVDVMVIMGPQVVRSGQVDVMMVFNRPMTDIHAAVDKILGRSVPVGGWMDDTAVPAAEGKADGADRLFVLVPKQSELYVTPPPRQKKRNKSEPDWDEDAKSKAIKDKIAKIARLKAPSSDVPFAIHISVKEPGKLSYIDAPLVGQVQLIPDTFEKFVLRVEPLDDGGAMVRIELWDDTKENAMNDLDGIQAKYELAQTAASMGAKLALPSMRFHVEGRMIFGEAEAPRELLEKMVAIGEEQIRKAKGQR